MIKNMKIIITLLVAICYCSYGASGDYALTDDLTLLIEDAKGNRIVCGHVRDHIKIRQAKVQAICEAKLNAKLNADKKSGVKVASELKDQGVVIPADIVSDIEAWIESDAKDPKKAEELKNAGVLVVAESIGAKISAEAKEEINNTK